MRLLGVIHPIYGLGTVDGGAMSRESVWKLPVATFGGNFESVRERGGKYKQVRKSRDPSTEQPGGRNELSRLKRDY